MMHATSSIWNDAPKQAWQWLKKEEEKKKTAIIVSSSVLNQIILWFFVLYVN